MALVAMAVFDNEENGRSKYTKATLNNFYSTVDWSKHRLIISDNGSCQETLDLYEFFKSRYSEYFPKENFKIIYNGRNIGTANAINKCWKYRKEGEHAGKFDNDIVVYKNGWLDEMEDCLNIQRKLGIICLKRRDLNECTTGKGNENTVLWQLPHKKGEKWYVIEQFHSPIGTAQLYSSLLLDKMGYLIQPATYGFDDTLSSIRSIKAGFANCYLTGCDIDHIDTGVSEGGVQTEFIKWKQHEAGKRMPEFEKMAKEFLDGTRPIFFEPAWEELEPQIKS